MSAFQLIDGNCIVIQLEGVDVYPNAQELYSICFDGGGEVRGHPIEPISLSKLGIDFLEFLGELVLRIKCTSDAGEPRLLIEAVVQFENLVGPVSSFRDGLLDYAVIEGKWVPISIESVNELVGCLAGLQADLGKSITLGQYFELQKYSPQAFLIVDLTAGELAGISLSSRVVGDIPNGFRGTLYSYQLKGYRWLSYITGQGIGAVIADEMGLGKTVQVVCLLIEAEQRAKTPNLVIAPATLLENWRREIGRFAPFLSTLVHRGPNRAGTAKEFARYDVVVSSYETVLADISIFRNFGWHLLIIDEAQAIKNSTTQRYVHIKSINRFACVAMTGTPIENSLSDVWSIFSLVLPGFLGDLNSFVKEYPNTTKGANLLGPRIAPILLRRTVAEVADDLPDRIEIPQPIDLDEEGSLKYESLRTEVLNSSERLSLALLVKLRMFCVHHSIVEDGIFAYVDESYSPKVKRLFEILEEIVSNGAKALIFCSFSAGIDLICHLIRLRFGILCEVIDGRIPVEDRQIRIDRFSQFQGSAILVLNPRAAGTGLNITAANHVIHFNPEWNPAIQDQASARAHRRGQLLPVTIHRLFYINTIEEVMDDRMIEKRGLAGTAILDNDGSSNDFEALTRALSISPMRINL